MPNTLAFQLYSLKDYEGGYPAAFEAVQALGIDTIEAWCGAVPAAAEGTTPVDDLRAALQDTGMSLTCGHVTATEFDTRYDPWRRLLTDFGSRDWVIPFARAEALEEWLALLPKFRQMAARLATDGLSLGYHNHAMELVRLGDKYVMEHLLDGMPELRAQFHIGQFLPERGIALPDWIGKYAGRICSLHVNDADSDGATRVGQGSCRAEDAIRAALDAGVDTFIMEIPFVEATTDGVRQDVETTRRLID